MSQLPYAHGGPPLTGVLKASPDDFVVIENLGFEADGEGEHVLLTLRKRGINTDWLAGQLADFAGVKRNAVSYSGMKDRHAVTTQSFSVQLPGADDPDWSQFPEADVEILSAVRHRRKLRRGALAGNHFEIVFRDLSGDKARAEECLKAIADQGVPNYFGEQRFGREGRNTDRAEAFFQGRRTPRKQQGMLISAARSQIFNDVLAERVQQASWNAAIDGEVCCLDGSRSWFVVEEPSKEIDQRLAAFDIHPSGPLWGSNALPSSGSAAELEMRVAGQHSILAEGLAKQRLDHDRRALRMRPKNLSWDWLEDAVLCVRFDLPAGCYATTVLRELTQWREEKPHTRVGD